MAVEDTKELNQTFWEQRWENADTPWDMGSPAPALTTYCSQLAHKDIAILIPGAGASRDVDWLWEQGFGNVHILDWSPTSLEAVRKRLPDFPAENCLCANFFEIAGQYDLILEQTFFCAIDPALRPQYAQHAAALLKPGGTVAGLLFDFPLESGPPFGGSAAEYLEYFSPYFEVKTMAPCYNSIPPRAGRELFFILKKRMLAG